MGIIKTILWTIMDSHSCGSVDYGLLTNIQPVRFSKQHGSINIILSVSTFLFFLALAEDCQSRRPALSKIGHWVLIISNKAADKKVCKR